MEKKIVIIGAGPMGLGAGYRLKELGYNNFRIFEQSSHLGGLASSYRDSEGFTWDVGGHVIFSHYSYYDKIFDELVGKDYQENMRECWVRMAERWVPYPFQNNIRHLPKETAYECLAGLIEAQATSDSKATKDFESFIYAVFGEGIAKHFMLPYNFKVWAYPASMMNKEWIGERVAVIDTKRALRNVLLEEDDYAWGPNNMFKYPLKGTGDFYARFQPTLEPHLTLNAAVEYIDVAGKQILLSDGEMVRYDVLLSAVPVDRLCVRLLNGQAPDTIKESASNLMHSSGYMVGVGIKQPCPSTKSWMYFPESNCPFYRATYLSNYSPLMTPDPERYYSLLCETSASPFKEVDRTTIVDDTVQGLVNAGMLKESDLDDIVSTWLYEADYSYPTPTVERDKILSEILPWLESRDIYSRGRFGLWKYEVSNTDHTLMQGVELVNRVLLGQPETTIGVKYASTENGREAAVHERPPVAGSGDPRKAQNGKVDPKNKPRISLQ